ncbi:probable sodium/metabolite cotransporter BASS1, chloroplastic [Herrania umbratica]|uniref:Probable sodium/metabolite cotransporter BASS1, chloroplastic n=1 Tax=Herrania umbratica TaxID=108875 RepID=A0A6J1AM25_9ROSI|nr:probable sodium/metabolite cotransporter BASS1, chloroplastic [Herrania umbratica]
MQSSLSCPQATTNFKFQQKSRTISTYLPPHQHLFISFPKPSNSSPFDLTLRSQSHEPPKRTTTSLTSKSFQLQCSISSDSCNPNNEKSFRDWVEWLGEVISTAFPLWVSLGCLFGLLKPTSFSWVTPRWNIFGLTLTMLGMGMTLTLDDLRGALAMPKELISGFVLQYSVMPLSGFLVSKLLNLPSHYAAGLILVGCCPGGTASNIVTYIARGNVALSVLMTAASTLSAVIMTPFLTAKLAGQYVAVDAAGLLISTLQVVLLPVLGGAFLNQYFQDLVKFVSPLMPPIAVGTVAILCGNAIAQSASAILASGQQVVLASSLLHVSGFFFGYILSRVLGLDVASSRTISIEVGMQNSVLGVVLASQHFQNPLTAVPCAVSSVCHSIFGSILAGIWRRTAPKQKQE